MKIRYDFVTNSSSTSYVVISENGAFDKETFMKTMGVSEESPLYAFYEQIFLAISEEADGFEAIGIRRDMIIGGARSHFENWKFPQSIQERAMQVLVNGGKIWIGRFSTEDGGARNFLLSDYIHEIGSDFEFYAMETDI